MFSRHVTKLHTCYFLRSVVLTACNLCGTAGKEHEKGT
jgi:hypothetical protein